MWPSLVMRCLRHFISWKLPQEYRALEVSPCRLHSCGLGQYFTFQCFSSCMGTKGVSHFPINLCFFKRKYESNSILSGLSLIRVYFYRNDHSVPLGRAYSSDSWWTWVFLVTRKWLVVSDEFHMRMSIPLRLSFSGWHLHYWNRTQ